MSSEKIQNPNTFSLYQGQKGGKIFLPALMVIPSIDQQKTGWLTSLVFQLTNL